MRASRFIVLICLLLVFNSCKEGAATLPELSMIIYKAIKANKFSDLSAAMPSRKAMEKYLELYEFNQFRDLKERKQEAINRVQANILSLKLEYDKMTESAQQAGIDLSQSRLSDFRYEINDTKEGFHQGLIKLMISSNNQLFKIRCTAVQVQDRWFLIPGMTVEK